MSREYHNAYREHLINKRFVKADRPLVINNWEATYFNFDTEKLMAISDAVKGTGIDTFVLDDGWFGERNNDFSGLGDWVVNTNKLNGSFKPLIEHIHKNGMKFGLWFEPEMVNEDSQLFRNHPDYAIGAPGRKPCYARHQRVLDITRKEVRDYIVSSVNTVSAENEIDYVKWDCNRNVTEFYSCGADNGLQAGFAHRYALGLYDLCERIVNANPNVFFEGCASGGARFDAGMLYYFPQIWTSDDSDAEERTLIQYGTSIVYPISAMSCHISVCPNHQTGRITSFKTRADIAQLGPTGYELDATSITDDERSQVSAQIEEYSRCQNLILDGELYRIDNPFEGNFFSQVVISKDKKCGFLIAYKRMRRTNDIIKRIKPAGLDDDKTYIIEELGIIGKGNTLMNVGIPVRFENP